MNDKTRIPSSSGSRFLIDEATRPRGSDAPPDSPMPDIIDEHRILRVLGSGGMGVVYLAKDPQLPRAVALKILSRSASRQSDYLRFLEEARITGHLAHPGIVPVYRYGEVPDPVDPSVQLRYFTMKPVHGDSLADILDNLARGLPSVVEKFDYRRLLTCFLRICEAIAFAHSRGVIHRDLKPSNIMIGDYGEVLVMDWGLAKIMTDERRAAAASASSRLAAGVLKIQPDLDERITEVGTIVGTPSFMSPEQAMGLEDQVDEMSDVYGLGAILYSMLTLWPPVNTGDVNQTLKAVAAGEIARPEHRAPEREIEPYLAELCMAAIQRDRQARISSAAELAARIQDYLEGRPPWLNSFSMNHDGADAGHISRDWRPVQGIFSPVGQGGVKSESVGESLLICRKSFAGNVRVQCNVFCEPGPVGKEIGIVLARPKNDPSESIHKGYILRFGANDNTCTKLSRDVTDVVLVSNKIVVPGVTYQIEAEKVEDRVILRINGKRVFEYRDFLPLLGERIGLYAGGAGVLFNNVRIESQGRSLRINALDLPDEFFRMGQYDRAMAGYQEIFDAHAGRLEGWIARYKQALCLQEAGRNEEAEAIFVSLFDSPLGAHALQGAAQMALERSDMEQVVAYLERCGREFAGDPALATIFAYTWDQAELFRTGKERTLDRRRAIALYQLALGFDPGRGGYYWRTMLTIAELLLILGKWDKAKRTYSEVAGNTPEGSIENRQAVIGLARLKLETGDIAGAIDAFTDIASAERDALEHSSGSSKYYLALAHYVNAATDKALETLSEIDPSNTISMLVVRARLLEAFCLNEMGLREAAEASIKSIEEWDGASGEGKLAGGRGLVRLHVLWSDYAEAIKLARALVDSREPGTILHAEALTELASVAWIARDTSLAYDAGMRIANDCPDARGDIWLGWLLCGLSLHAMGEIVQAHILMHRAMELDDHSGRILLRFAMKEVDSEAVLTHIRERVPFTQQGEIAFWAAETARTLSMNADAKTLYQHVLAVTHPMQFPYPQAKIQLESIYT